MVELSAYGQQFELGSKSAEIKYTKQVSDIFDLAVVASSYTNGFSIPKTPNNTQIMNQLGIIGDTSQIPYSKVPSSLTHYGFPLFQNGWLTVKETGNEYSVSVIDGMIDFFKAIENKTMGTDLDLSNFNHIKDLPSVLESFTNIYYKYIVADYNGKNLGVYDTDTGINIDYLVPCFNMGKLFDLVMTTFGFTYDNTNIDEIDDLYITYPKAPEETIIDELSAGLELDPFISGVVSVGSNYYSSPLSYKSWSSSTINAGTLLGNWRYEIAEDSSYKIDVSTEMYARYQLYLNLGSGYQPTPNFQFKPVEVTVRVNGVNVISFNSDPYAEVVRSVSLYLNQGDVVEYDFKVTPFSYIATSITKYQLIEMRGNGTTLNISKTNQGNINLADAFKDFLIKDFIKDIFIRTATTPIINTLTNTITFKTIEQRLDFTNHVDWSEKYIKRTKEIYIQGSYAQKNSFSHKYNDSNDISQNGYLYVNNQNIEASRVLYDSKIYAPELLSFEFATGVQTNKFTVWQRESKEDAEGNMTVSYKGLNGRFYVMKLKDAPTSTYQFVSEAVPQIDSVTTFPYADTVGTTFDQIIPIKYASYSGVLNNFRAHEIEVALDMNDILGLDLTKPVRFDKEGMYYILNRISFSEGKNAVGEFIRINKVIK